MPTPWLNNPWFSPLIKGQKCPIIILMVFILDFLLLILSLGAGVAIENTKSEKLKPYRHMNFHI
ncbi:hypothetical protein MUS1_14740 [Marinomonas ushuaiensis DSM 15871]|uniref:Uncharacterized protein n=1 Tax=Marinomonas ushuaiensis DSM 15871 TaxID=1122207 RepID=X7E3W7_9GAMM|nr:hypothetical protein MUS1_14740 [Marinomonas ushuaiensis DSM 15871]